jgi:hypothetical protein
VLKTSSMEEVFNTQTNKNNKGKRVITMSTFFRTRQSTEHRVPRSNLITPGTPGTSLDI